MSESPHDFRHASAAALANQPMRAAILRTTSRKIEARTIALQQLGRADELRHLASRIKQHTLDHLDEYLERFIERAEATGATMHFAATADDARRIVGQIAATRAAKLCVKAKSMTTEEIHLNESLIAAGVRVVETDLGEFIVQLDHDRPSHIVTPIIHKDRKTIARIIARELGVEYTEDAEQLVAHARTYLREIFRACDLGISGANFAIAETGGICLCTNEGNGRLTSTRPRVHVAIMGIEKLIPRLADLPVFLKLLARSSTGQHMTVYTTLIHGPRQPADADGPDELHIVLLDAGRTSILAGDHRDVLRCIRCGACLNACPVYRQIGGHAYGGVYPGPIGKLLGPLLSDNVHGPSPAVYGGQHFAELPRASSLCGLCREVCPVDIDIPGHLVALRREQVERRARGWRQCAAFWLAACMLKSPWAYRLMQRAARLLLGSRGWSSDAPPPLNAVTKHRDVRTPAQKPFRQIWNDVLQNESAPLVREPLVRESFLAPTDGGIPSPDPNRDRKEAASDPNRSLHAATASRCSVRSTGGKPQPRVKDEGAARTVKRFIGQPTSYFDQRLHAHPLSTAGTRFLQRIRDAVRIVPPAAREPLPPIDDATVRRLEAPIRTPYVSRGSAGDDVGLIEAFHRRAADAGMAPSVVNRPDLGAHIATILRDAGAKQVICEPQLADPPWQIPKAAGSSIEWLDPTHGDKTLYAADAAITTVFAAIAETGSIVCTSGAGCRRSLSLIPPLHIAIVEENQIRADLVDLFQAPTADPPPAQLVIITGPSKTADIDGILITGLHGPRAVHVCIVTPADPNRP